VSWWWVVVAGVLVGGTVAIAFALRGVARDLGALHASVQRMASTRTALDDVRREAATARTAAGRLRRPDRSLPRAREQDPAAQ
jgi:hypothetical protein